MATVSEHFFAHEGKCCDKWENYLDVYGVEFERIVNRGVKVSLLEIGVQDGGSLEIWQKVLPVGSNFTGIDIDPRVGLLEYGPGISVIVGDASDPQVLDSVLAGAVFDVIIDDGSHRSEDIIASFKALFGRLRPGGIYCIEDLACSYGRHFDVGLRHPEAAIEWLKRLVDGLHADHWNAADVDDTDQPFREIFAPWVERVTFYESLAVIAKRATPKTVPVRRVLTGRTVTQSDHYRIFATDFPNNPPHHRFGAAFASELALYIARERDARMPLPAPLPAPLTALGEAAFEEAAPIVDEAGAAAQPAPELLPEAELAADSVLPEAAELPALNLEAEAVAEPQVQLTQAEPEPELAALEPSAASAIEPHELSEPRDPEGDGEQRPGLAGPVGVDDHGGHGERAMNLAMAEGHGHTSLIVVESTDRSLSTSDTAHE